MRYKGEEFHVRRNPRAGYSLPWLWGGMIRGHLLHGAADTKAGAIAAAREAIDKEATT